MRRAYLPTMMLVLILIFPAFIPTLAPLPSDASRPSATVIRVASPVGQHTTLSPCASHPQQIWLPEPLPRNLFTKVSGGQSTTPQYVPLLKPPLPDVVYEQDQHSRTYRPVKSPVIVVRIPIKVSLEWDSRGTDAITQTVIAMSRTSQWLLHATDHQFAINPLVVTDNACGWANADIRIYANNMMVPNSSVGGINPTVVSANPPFALPTNDFPPGAIRLGRSWSLCGSVTYLSTSATCPSSLPYRYHKITTKESQCLQWNFPGLHQAGTYYSPQCNKALQKLADTFYFTFADLDGWYHSPYGSWMTDDGARAIVHELGHYALYLQDEYFGYTDHAKPGSSADSGVQIAAFQRPGIFTGKTNTYNLGCPIAMINAGDQGDIAARTDVSVMSSPYVFEKFWAFTPTPTSIPASTGSSSSAGPTPIPTPNLYSCAFTVEEATYPNKSDWDVILSAYRNLNTQRIKLHQQPLMATDTNYDDKPNWCLVYQNHPNPQCDQPFLNTHSIPIPAPDFAAAYLITSAPISGQVRVINEGIPEQPYTQPAFKDLPAFHDAQTTGQNFLHILGGHPYDIVRVTEIDSHKVMSQKTFMLGKPNHVLTAIDASSWGAPGEPYMLPLVAVKPNVQTIKVSRCGSVMRVPSAKSAPCLVSLMISATLASAATYSQGINATLYGAGLSMGRKGEAPYVSKPVLLCAAPLKDTILPWSKNMCPPSVGHTYRGVLSLIDNESSVTPTVDGAIYLTPNDPSGGRIDQNEPMTKWAIVSYSLSCNDPTIYLPATADVPDDNFDLSSADGLYNAHRLRATKSSAVCVAINGQIIPPPTNPTVSVTKDHAGLVAPGDRPDEATMPADWGLGFSIFGSQPMTDTVVVVRSPLASGPGVPQINRYSQRESRADSRTGGGHLATLSTSPVMTLSATPVRICVASDKNTLAIKPSNVSLEGFYSVQATTPSSAQATSSPCGRPIPPANWDPPPAPAQR